MSCEAVTTQFKTAFDWCWKSLFKVPFKGKLFVDLCEEILNFVTFFDLLFIDTVDGNGAVIQ